MEAGDETTMAYDIPGGWYMAFDTTGAPLFWHNDVNEGAITWTPPWIQRQDTNNELQNQNVHILAEPQRIQKSILPSTKEGATSVPGALTPTNQKPKKRNCTCWCQSGS